MPYVNTHLSDSEPGKNEVQVHGYSAEACGMPCWSKDLVRCIGQLSRMRRKSQPLCCTGIVRSSQNTEMVLLTEAT